MNFWKSLLARFIKREPQVASLIGEFNKKREELVDAANKLKDLVAERKAQAEDLLAKAKAHQDDADWAQKVADKVADLISK